MKLRLTVGDQKITATPIDSETTRDFISLLPLTLTMNDLFEREKFAPICRERFPKVGSGRRPTKSAT